MIETSVECIGDVFLSEILIDGEGSGLFDIPPIQREYQWGIGHNSNEKINRSAKELIDDLLNFHKFNTDNEFPYFTGTVIVYQEDDAAQGHYQLMDGQQRWTTYTALMSTIYYWLDQSTRDDWSEVMSDISHRFLVSEEHEFRLQSHRSYDDQLIWELSNITGAYEIEEWDHEEYNAPTSKFRPYEKTYTGTNLQCVAMFFKDTLSEVFNVEGPLSDMSSLVEFYKTIRDRVFVNITVAPSSSVAYEMFITANARGTPLNNFDIFRGLIITRERELELDISERVRTRLQSTQERLTEYTNFRDKKDRDDEINTVMAQICSVLSGQRVEKATVMFFLKQQIRELNSVDEIMGYCNFVSRYVYVRNRIDLRQLFAGELPYNRLAYMGFTSHIPIFTTAAMDLLADPTEERAMEKLIAGIECLVMRCTLGTRLRDATLYFWANAPSIAHQVYSNGLSLETVDQILLDFQEWEGNPETLNLLATKGYSIPDSFKQKDLISAFYALESINYGPYSSGEGVNQTRLTIPFLPLYRAFSQESQVWEYGQEGVGQSNSSYTIGNMFLLTPPATVIRESLDNTRLNVGGRLAMFRNRSAGMVMSADVFLDVQNWTEVHVNNRTRRLVERFEGRFPRSCSL